MPAAGSLLTAVETKTRSPQTIGLETATPRDRRLPQHVLAGRDVPCHRRSARRRRRPTPAGPRNDGQFCADTGTHAATDRTIGRIRRVIYLPSTRVQVTALLGKPIDRHLVAVETNRQQTRQARR